MNQCNEWSESGIRCLLPGGHQRPHEYTIVAAHTVATGFKKYDQGKPRLAILFDHPEAMTQVAEVLHFGAQKYGRLNWVKCDSPERYIDAALRHIMARVAVSATADEGTIPDLSDSESARPHLAHAIACLLFALELDERG